MRTFWLLPAVLLLAAGAARAAETTADIAADEEALKAAKVATDGPGLVDYFRKRLPREADEKRIAELVRQLGDDSFQAREKAAADLVAIGQAALVQLRQAENSADAEVKRRAHECAEKIERAAGPDVTGAAVRVLVARAPEGACAALLDFLPAAGEATEDVLAALAAVGVKGGKADPALAAALQDKVAAKRAAAAVVLGRSGPAEQRDVVRKLLGDDDALVRLRAAQGLLAARDKEAVPALVALLGEAPPAIAQEAEDVLHWLAGDQAPKGVALGEDKATRTKCREAWAGWWKQHGDALDLTKAEVDLPWLIPGQRARTAAQQFLDALMKGDATGLLKVSDVPFSMAGFQKFDTRESLEKFFTEAFGPKGRPKVEVKITKVVPGAEYAKGDGAEFKEMLAGLPKGDFRAVYADGKTEGQDRTDTAVLVVSLVGGRAKVVGIAPLKPLPLPK
jgi:HEAT repeats